MKRNALDHPRQDRASLGRVKLRSCPANQIEDAASEHVGRGPDLIGPTTVSHTAKSYCKLCHELNESERDHHLVSNFDTRKCDTQQLGAVAEIELMQGAASSQHRDVNQPSTATEIERVQGAAPS